ncbi:cbb3-type cytochrome oxidase assembly protein CcoS [Campylobacter corcagiensis]|uniref:Cbb3-type cytochrome oxidase assembly protein CcoS n=1 Tax=Campylobacter corcagiensis TaxID=1448857 RepID=A0A7M1LIJ0_9BACT|nr:cbb3-type cytochrome oxidase assembly protein CcoS [Campylobacter corcagiensis]QKF64128.1 cytochrome oxidase maturation protein, cbb3-type [Campylobacter corcagiensis]QOQ87676.1 cbb3-type cytochrome oxidase assembly protein CcoS [Campylobacter corcagiensis]
MSGILALMILVSLTVGVLLLVALLWGIKSGQFEDYSKFLDGTKFDSEEALNDAIKMEEKRKQAKSKKSDRYELPD